MRNIPLCRALVLQTELCVPRTCFQIRFKKKEHCGRGRAWPFGIPTNMTYTCTQALASHSYILTHAALIPYPLHSKLCYQLQRETKQHEYNREGGKKQYLEEEGTNMGDERTEEKILCNSIQLDTLAALSMVQF